MTRDIWKGVYIGLAIAAAVLGISNAIAQQEVVSVPYSLQESSMVSVNTPITGSVQTIPLVAGCSSIQMWTDSGAANCNVKAGTTAGSGNAIIYPGGSQTFKIKRGWSHVAFKGVTATGTMNYMEY